MLPFQDTANLLSAIIVLCFSFCILTVTYWNKNAEVLQRLLGYSFFPLFLLNSTALLVNDTELSGALSQTAKPLLLLLMTLLLAVRPGKSKYRLCRFLIISLPSLMLLAAVFSSNVRSFMAQQLTSLSALVAISIAALYLLKKEKDDTNLLFWSVLSLLASGFAQYYLAFGLAVFIPPFLQFYAFTVFLMFFYRVFFKFQLGKIQDTEKKLAEINRSIDLEVKKRMLEIEKVNQNLLNISKTDPMSKVLNKGALLDAIDNLISRKPNLGFSILMMDIDHFKNINDTLGHITGDKCIKLLAAIARNSVRDFDLIGRYGGDEFIIVLPDIDTSQAVTIAERFRQRVETTASPHYTVSIGIASYPADGSDVKTLIEVADEGLYKSKHKGRNAVSHKSFY